MPRGRRGGRGRGATETGSGRSARAGGGRGWSGREPARPPAMCRFYLEGRCNRGSNCRFRHGEHHVPRESNATDVYGSSNGRNFDYSSSEKDEAYYASIDEAYDGLWSAAGHDGMLIQLDDVDFMEDQEANFLFDVNNGDARLSDRKDEFVRLDMATIMEVVASLSDRGLHIASCVTRRLVEDGPCPPMVRISRLDDKAMRDLVAHKKRGNEHFAAKRYQDAIEEYNEALLYVLETLFVAPKTQVGEVVNVLANRAECHLRLHEYTDAGQSATDALLFDCFHEKARIRRAKAELAIYKDENAIPYLAQACHDLEMILEDPDAGDLATETSRALLDEAGGFMEREKEKWEEEKPDSDFQLYIRMLKSKAW